MNQVVITGIGAITSLGSNVDTVLTAFKNEQTSFTHCEWDPELVICPVHDFNLKAYTGRFKNSRYLTRGGALALAAAIAAVQDAGIQKSKMQSTGLFVGAGPHLDIGGTFPDINKGTVNWNKISALWLLKFLPNTTASAISQYLQIHGESATLGSACAASLHAIGQAFLKIKWGHLQTALAGGGDSRLSAGALMAYKKAHAIYTGTGNPAQACRPFDKKRAGFVCGEGGAFFVLEEMSQAQKRGANIYAEILGFGTSTDAGSMTAPEPDGKWAQVAVEQALFQAGVSVEDIGTIVAHGTGTSLNDSAEAQMLARIFKNQKPVIISLKSWIGHLAAACGAVELALFLYCLTDQYGPLIRNLKEPCVNNLSFATNCFRLKPKTFLLENFGFGGQNCVLVVKP